MPAMCCPSAAGPSTSASASIGSVRATSLHMQHRTVSLRPFSPRSIIAVAPHTCGRISRHASASPSARFASQMLTSIAAFDNPTQLGNIQYRFQDVNGDRLAQIGELLGPTGTVSNVNPADPTASVSPNQVNPNLRSPATQAVVAGVERELMPDF